MNLDEGQRRKVAEWIEEGLKLSEIQTRIVKEFGISMTYMDVRFLIDDLKLKPKDAPPTAPVTVGAAKQPAGAAPAKAPMNPPATDDVLPTSAVSVSVDHVARPGAMVSGRVKFSDGKGGAWLIDQMGRPGLIPDEQGYRPSQQDISEFQVQLQEELARMGF